VDKDIETGMGLLEWRMLVVEQRVDALFSLEKENSASRVLIERKNGDKYDKILERNNVNLVAIIVATLSIIGTYVLMHLGKI
jgi:hypothetical protein